MPHKATEISQDIEYRTRSESKKQGSVTFKKRVSEVNLQSLQLEATKDKRGLSPDSEMPRRSTKKL